MQNTITEEKLEKYFKITSKALGEAKGKVADLGGNVHSYRFLHTLFPAAAISTVNNYKPHLEGCRKGFLVDVEKDNLPFAPHSIDLVFALDIMEHLINSEVLIEKARKVLRKGGLMVITTPNFASLYNRLFLLLGYSFSNYHPSRYRTGNPFFKIKDAAPLWNEHAHKSVFTPRALKELLEIYSFRVLWRKGFSYSQEIAGGSERNVRMRKLINAVLPIGLKEGILIIAVK